MNQSSLTEEGTSNGLAITFDTWDNDANDVAPVISIKFNGTTIAAVLMAESNPNADPAYVLPVPTDPATGSPMTLFTGDKFVSAQIELRNDGRMDVSYKNVKVLANVATGYTPRSGQFGFAARTGGSYAAHWIDDLTIVVNRDTAAGVPDFASSVATNLNSWIANTTFRWPDTAGRPRVVNAISVVGQRIAAPGGELGASADYLAGHINVSGGTLFNPQAYLDPFVGGFSLANAGAIIPVNAVPGTNTLEVWWFRTNSASAGLNAGGQCQTYRWATFQTRSETKPETTDHQSTTEGQTPGKYPRKQPL